MAERKTSKQIVTFPEKDEAGNPHPNAGKPTGQIVFTFSDNSTETFDVTKVGEDIKFRAMLHGFSQKIGDSYAGAAATEDPLAYAKSAVRDTIAQLYRGEWRVAASGGGGPRVSDLATAIAQVTGESLEECVEFVGAMTDEEKKVWRKKPKIAAALAQMAAERAAAKAAALAAEAANAADADVALK